MEQNLERMVNELARSKPPDPYLFMMTFLKHDRVIDLRLQCRKTFPALPSTARLNSPLETQAQPGDVAIDATSLPASGGSINDMGDASGTVPIAALADGPNHKLADGGAEEGSDGGEDDDDIVVGDAEDAVDGTVELQRALQVAEVDRDTACREAAAMREQLVESQAQHDIM